MTPQDLFGVAVRVSGLWIALYGVYTLIYAMAYFYSGPPQNSDNKADQHSAYQFLFAGSVMVFMGAGIISLADEIVRLSY